MAEKRPEDRDHSVVGATQTTGVEGVESIVKAFNSGSPEVKNLLKEECDVVLECRYCRNLFRSMINFITHKRIYCKGQHNANVANAEAVQAMIDTEANRWKERDSTENTPTSSQADPKKARPIANLLANLKQRDFILDLDIPNSELKLPVHTLPKIGKDSPLLTHESGYTKVVEPSSVIANLAQIPPERVVTVFPKPPRRRNKVARRVADDEAVHLAQEEVTILERCLRYLDSRGIVTTRGVYGGQYKCIHKKCVRMTEMSVKALAYHICVKHVRKDKEGKLLCILCENRSKSWTTYYAHLERVHRQIKKEHLAINVTDEEQKKKRERTLSPEFTGKERDEMDERGESLDDDDEDTASDGTEDMPPTIAPFDYDAHMASHDESDESRPPDLEAMGSFSLEKHETGSKRRKHGYPRRFEHHGDTTSEDRDSSGSPELGVDSSKDDLEKHELQSAANSDDIVEETPRESRDGSVESNISVEVRKVVNRLVQEVTCDDSSVIRKMFVTYQPSFLQKHEFVPPLRIKKQAVISRRPTSEFVVRDDAERVEVSVSPQPDEPSMGNEPKTAAASSNVANITSPPDDPVQPRTKKTYQKHTAVREFSTPPDENGRPSRSRKRPDWMDSFVTDNPEKPGRGKRARASNETAAPVKGPEKKRARSNSAMRRGKREASEPPENAERVASSNDDATQSQSTDFVIPPLSTAMARIDPENRSFVLTPNAQSSMDREDNESPSRSRRKQNLDTTNEDDGSLTVINGKYSVPTDLNCLPVRINQEESEMIFGGLIIKDKTVERDKVEYDCKFCDAASMNSAAARRHIVSHMRVIRLRCTLCQAGSFFCNELRQHIKYQMCPNIKMAPPGSIHTEMSGTDADKFIEIANKQKPGGYVFTSGMIVSDKKLRPYIPNMELEEKILGPHRGFITKSASAARAPRPAGSRQVTVPKRFAQ